MNQSPSSRRSAKVILAAPRGFCAGVDRAIQIVERALEKFGTPVYVRHEIVHNRYVVERLEKMGAIFVEELDEAPDDRPVVFSAHGVPKSVPNEAKRRNMIYVDATCPLVSKVHVQADQRRRAGDQIILIGHDGHPEVVGTMGQLPEGAIKLIETPEDARSFTPADGQGLSLITQTTLSVDDTAEIVAILQDRFPHIHTPHKEDICYATTNRQEAVKAMAPQCDIIFVIGARNSSNSMRLVEVAERSGCPKALLIARAADIDWQSIGSPTTIGITAGASAPDILVEELLDDLKARFDTTIETLTTSEENVTFKLPAILSEHEAT